MKLAKPRKTEKRFGLSEIECVSFLYIQKKILAKGVYEQTKLHLIKNQRIQNYNLFSKSIDRSIFFTTVGLNFNIMKFTILSRLIERLLLPWVISASRNFRK